MIWQDWVISIGQWIFVIALIPTIRGKQKPELATSLTTAVILAIFAFTFSTLDLWASALSSTATSASWFILTYQKYRQKK